jgi:pilus assembly protein CpaF
MKTEDILGALGPLAPLYEDRDVFEILVDGPDRVYVEYIERRDLQLEDAGITFESPEAIRAVIDQLLALVDISLGPRQTVGAMRFPDDTRMLAVIPPTAVNGPLLAIRKVPPPTMTWERLFELGAFSRAGYDLLQRAIQARVNILVAGGVASGKSTITNLLANSIPPGDRLVVVEEVRELRITHERCVFLEAGGPPDLTLVDLLPTAERLRPDWLIVGQLHGPEAMHALHILGLGLSGLLTIHAISLEDALTRLESMCLMANLGLGLCEIRAVVASALNLISYQERLPDGSRKIVQIVELCGLDADGHYVLQPLFRYNSRTGEFEMTGAKPSWE